MLSFVPYFFLYLHVCYVVRGGTLGIHQRGATQGVTELWLCMWGRHPTGNNAACLALSWLAFSHFPHYPQANWAALLLTPSWVHLRTSGTLWVSPMNSPVRLGVPPTAIPPQVFTVRGFNGVLPHAGTLSGEVCLAPHPGLSI